MWGRGKFTWPSRNRDPKAVRCFSTFTRDLQALAAWLLACRIRTVAMESTGVYWIPLFQILEAAGIEVCLVNSRHVKHVPGRKSDVLDCQWLQYLHSVGLLRASFRPADVICQIRSLLRHREGLVEMAAQHVQHMQKALSQMNLQLHHVLSDLTGQSGLAILDAILTGERDPRLLAELRDGRVKASAETIAQALVGDYRREHLFTLNQSLQAYRYYHQLLAACDQEIETYLRELDSKIDVEQNPLAPEPKPHKPRKNEFHFDLRSELYRILGVDLTAVPGLNALSVHTLLGEIGRDVSRFPNATAFASWLGLCPRTTKRAGARCCRPKLAGRKTGSTAPCALPPKLYTAARPIWETTIAECAVGWERPRPSRRRLINWPALCSISYAREKPITKVFLPRKSNAAACAPNSASAAMPASSDTN